MRIVCDSCGTKYSISDEKVRGKLFKFRCKNCSHVIIVRGDQQQPAEEAVQDTSPVMSGAPDTGEVADEWFYVLDGQQAGPVTTDEVGALVAAGEILADTYMWREGMDDWLHIADIPELAHLADGLEGAWDDDTDAGAGAGNGHDLGPSVFAGSGAGAEYVDDDEATRVTAAPAEEDDEEEEAPPAGLFGGGGGGLAATSRDRRPEGLAPSYAGGGDLFEEPAPPARGSGGGIFATGEGLAMSTASDAGVDERMVGQRNENSVLFSLDTLQSVESGDSNGNLPTTEGSGLIDIKALAASQAATGASVLEGESISADQPMVTPAVMPMGQRQSHRLLYGLIAAGAVVIIGLVLAIVIVLTRGTETPTSEVAANQGTPSATDSAPTQPAPNPEAAPTGPTEVAAGMPTEAPAPTGPTAEEMRAATAGGALIAASIANTAQGSAQEIASRPAPRTASRERDSSREERGSSHEARTEERTAQTEREEPRRDRHERDRTEREHGDTAADPVSAALSQIRRDDSSREEPSSHEEPAEEQEAAPSRSDLPEQLTTSQVSRTIRRYERRLAECRQQSELPSGQVLRVDVAMTLQGNGRVAAARTDSGDRAASCIVDVVREMRFDEFSGDAMNFTYPFRVR